MKVALSLIFAGVILTTANRSGVLTKAANAAEQFNQLLKDAGFSSDDVVQPSPLDNAKHLLAQIHVAPPSAVEIAILCMFAALSIMLFVETKRGRR